MQPGFARTDLHRQAGPGLADMWVEIGCCQCLGYQSGRGLLFVAQFRVAVDGAPQFDSSFGLLANEGMDPLEMADDDLLWAEPIGAASDGF